MARKTYIEILQELKKLKTNNEKLQLLMQERDNHELQTYFKYALDPSITFGVKKIPEYQTPDRPSFNFGNIYHQLNRLVNRELTGNTAIAFLRNIFDSITAEEAEILETIIKKKPNCGVNVKTVNKVWENLVKDYPVMLCYPATDERVKKLKWPVYAQIKYDGARANVIVRKSGHVEIVSRTGKPIHLPVNNIHENVKKIFGTNVDYVLDGELLVIDEYNSVMPRQKGNGILNKAIRGKIKEDEATRVIFMVWDVIPWADFQNGSFNTPYSKRITELTNRWSQNRTDELHVKVAETRIMKSWEEAQNWFDEVVAQGYEGIILKDPDAPWEAKRVSHQLKMKVEKTADLIVKSLVEGIGKYAGKLGSFLCTDKTGTLNVNVGTGFSDEQRDEYFSDSLIGKIIEVKYNELIQDAEGNRSLFLPVFVQVREDKHEPNTLDEL